MQEDQKLQDINSRNNPIIYVAVCTPSIGLMRTRYTTSLVRMILYYQNKPVLGREKDLRFLSYHVIDGSMVGSAREEMVRDILALPNITHLLFIDEDMGFREDTLNILLSRQMPFVSCNYRMKVPPCNFTCRNPEDTNWIDTTEEKSSLEEAYSTGFGFSLIERQVLEKLKSPMFSNVWSDKYNTYSTEDRSFCILAREAGFPVYVDHKASKRVYHVGNYSYSYDDNFPAYKRKPKAERMQTKNNATTTTGENHNYLKLIKSE